MNRFALSCLALVAFTALAACGGGGGDSAERNTSSPAQIEARATYARTCAMCHGAEGRGDGMMAANLNPKPKDYTDREWQQSATDDYLKAVILEGGRSHGLSPLMPATPELADKPEVLDALVARIRSFAP